MPGMNTGGLLRAGVWWVLRVLLVFIETPLTFSNFLRK